MRSPVQRINFSFSAKELEEVPQPLESQRTVIAAGVIC